MKEKKGFTLIELLAVIVILAIISLIATPIVLNLIEKTRIGSQKNSVMGIIKSAKLYYSADMIDNSISQIDEDENILNKLSFDGRKPEEKNYSGYGVYLNNNGDVSVALAYENNCYIKKFEEKEIKKVNANMNECHIPGLDVWDGSSEEMIPEGDIYYISKGANLAWLSEKVAEGNTFEGKTFILTDNINMGAEFDESGNLISGQKFTPIGFNGNYFYGNFEGNNNYISNLYINETEKFVGLIGRYSTGKFENLIVKDSYIFSSNNVAGIIGGNSSTVAGSTIHNVKSINNIIKSNGWTGGIIGQAIDTNISNCYSNSKIYSTTKEAGGITGYLENGTINESKNDGYIYAQNYAGGISGWIKNSTLATSMNNGLVESSSYGAGGIAGVVNGAIVDQNINNGTIQGEVKWIGGIVGINSGSSGISTLSNNINHGNVITLHGAFRVAGIVGNANSNILVYNNINKGNIDGIGDGTSTIYGIGGIIGTIGAHADYEVPQLSYVLNNYNMGSVKGRMSTGGIIGNLYQDTTNNDWVLNVYNEGSIDGTTGYAGGILGKAYDGDVVERFITNSYNRGNVKGLNAAGLIGSSVGISNSINYVAPTGSNNFGIIAETAGTEELINNYYINTVSSNFGIAKTQDELTNEFAKTVLGLDAWNYDGIYPQLKKVDAKVIDGRLDVNYLDEILK